jgi:hypothetical protein
MHELRLFNILSIPYEDDIRDTLSGYKITLSDFDKIWKCADGSLCGRLVFPPSHRLSLEFGSYDDERTFKSIVFGSGCNKSIWQIDIRCNSDYDYASITLAYDDNAITNYGPLRYPSSCFMFFHRLRIPSIYEVTSYPEFTPKDSQRVWLPSK